jgi:hypothetical protein
MSPVYRSYPRQANGGCLKKGQSMTATIEMKRYKVTVDGVVYVIRAESKNDAKFWGTKQNPDFTEIKAEEID